MVKITLHNACDLCAVYVSTGDASHIDHQYTEPYATDFMTRIDESLEDITADGYILESVIDCDPDKGCKFCGSRHKHVSKQVQVAANK